MRPVAAGKPTGERVCDKWREGPAGAPSLGQQGPSCASKGEVCACPGPPCVLVD